MKLNKAWFFFTQFSFLEFITLLGYRLFGGGVKSLKGETYKFFEERFKAGTIIRRIGNRSVADYKINDRNYEISIRRFSSDMLVFSQVMVKREFEPVIEVFSKNNFVPEFMLDGGANIGLSTLFMKANYPEIKIIAIEPNDYSFELLQHNVTGNRLNFCNLVKAGLWSVDEPLQEARNIKGDEWGFAVKKNEVNDQALNTIDGRTVVSVIQENGWPRIDYLKLDIEGAEEELFKGRETYHSFLSVTHAISVEIHRTEFEIVFKEILVSYGFQVYEFGELIFGFRKEI